MHNLKGSEKKEFMRQAQMIFQDPYSSLDPRLKVHDIIAEGMRIHHLTCSKAEEIEEVQKLLKQVGLIQNMQAAMYMNFQADNVRE